MITLLNKFDDGYIIQRKDVLDIISHYTEKDHLENFIKDVTFGSNNEHAGTYNLDTYKIALNDDMILENCYELFGELSRIYNIDRGYYPYFINFYYLHTLFHEIEHAKQEKNYQLMRKSNLYEKLYELGRTLQMDNIDFYRKNHSLFPMEIDANNNGYLESYNLLSHTKLPRRETRILYLQYLFSLSYNYQKVTNNYILSPIEKLIEQSNGMDILTLIQLLKETHLSKIERLNLGLIITPSEFNSIEHEKNKILCKRNMLSK